MLITKLSFRKVKLIDDIGTVAGILTKYFVILVFVTAGIAMLWGIAEKIRNEPWALVKLVFAVLTPFALAFCVPYYVLHQLFDLPFWLNVVAGFFIYAYSHSFVEKHVDVRFKDEKH